MVDADVVVVGAGPAGIAASITLARAGREVVVVDKARFPRDKICGDGLTALALRELEFLGLEPSAVESWQPVRDVTIRSPKGRTVRFPLPDDGLFAVIATRRDLDAALVDLARKHGVTVLEGRSLVSATDGSHAITIGTSAGSVSGRVAIGADGMWSPLRKAVGQAVPDHRGEWHAFRQYFECVTGPAATELVVCFEPDFLPGYFWSFPLPDGRANVGFGIERGGSVRTADMKALWPDLLARPHVRRFLGPDAVATEPHRAWPIPARIDTMTTGVGRTVFAGDAVAACDVLTGEGIGQALLTGRLAGEAAHRHIDRPNDLQRWYHDEVQKHLEADHRMSTLLVRAVRHRKGARAAVWLAGTTDWTRRNFARWLFEDYPRGIAFTPSRWRRGLMSGPGAYR